MSTVFPCSDIRRESHAVFTSCYLPSRTGLRCDSQGGLDPDSRMVDLSSMNCSGLLIHGTQSENSEFCGNQNQNSESSVISILIDSESEFYINTVSYGEGTRKY